MNYAVLTDGEIGSTLSRLRQRHVEGFFTFTVVGTESRPKPRFVGWAEVADLVSRCVTVREACAVVSWLGPLKIVCTSHTLPSWAKCPRLCPELVATVPNSDGTAVVSVGVNSYNAEEWDQRLRAMALPVPGLVIDLGRPA